MSLRKATKKKAKVLDYYLKLIVHLIGTWIIPILGEKSSTKKFDNQHIKIKKMSCWNWIQKIYSYNQQVVDQQNSLCFQMRSFIKLLIINVYLLALFLIHIPFCLYVYVVLWWYYFVCRYNSDGHHL